jgi:hypothetical protein
MSRLLIVGICGAIESGKDQTAKILVALHGFRRYSLGDGPKYLVESAGGETKEVDKILDSLGMTKRDAWQKGGTETREKIGARYLWTDLLCAKIALMYDTLGSLLPEAKRPCRFVVPDVRFPYEPEKLKELADLYGGVYQTWRVRNQHAEDADDRHKSHSSEQHFAGLPVDQEIHNDHRPSQSFWCVGDSGEITPASDRFREAIESAMFQMEKKTW